MASVRERIQKFSGNSVEQSSSPTPASSQASRDSSFAAQKPTDQSKGTLKAAISDEEVEKENKPAPKRPNPIATTTKTTSKTSAPKKEMTTTKTPPSPIKRHSVVPKNIAAKPSTDEKRRASVPVSLLSPTKSTSGRPNSSLSQKSSSSNKTVTKPPVVTKTATRPTSTGGRPVASTVGLGRTTSLRMGKPKDELERLKSELAGLRARNKELESKISGLKGTIIEESCVNFDIPTDHLDEVAQLKVRHQQDLRLMEEAHKTELEKLSSAVSTAISENGDGSIRFAELIKEKDASALKIAEHELKIEQLEKLIRAAEDNIKDATLEVENTKAASEREIASREQEFQRLKQELDSSNEKLAHFTSKAEHNDERVNGEGSSSMEEIDRLKVELEQVRQKVSRSDEELHRIKGEAERSLEAKDREMDGLYGVLKSLKDELHNLNDTKEREAQDLIADQKAEFEAQLQSSHERNAALCRELDEKTEEFRTIINSKGSEIEGLQAQLVETKSEAADIRDQNKQDKKELEDMIIQLTSEISRLASEHEEHLNELEATLENDLVAKFNYELAAVKAEHDNDLEEVARTVEKDHENELAVLRNKHDALYQELAAERDSRAETVEEARKEGALIARSEAEEQIARLRIENTQMVRSESQKELDSLKQTYELELKELKAEISSLETSKQVYIAKINKLESSVNDIEATLNDQLEKGAKAADVMEVIRRETKKAHNDLQDAVSKLAASQEEISKLESQVSTLETTNQIQKEELEKHVSAGKSNCLLM
ncbi:hypothetical protein NEOLI_000556 [Neolecta irregularis DAH-3]|uniref:Uncharacterized protein n=1 Tax=Neolecta irregularis (strain DAH-3) TaxID=1198029 RepID=A0A1U7LT60_NEOID|nr:hypothetical protein NEOLI_000556 [Neolecta irregularis DAH-3]|eukprot:OLL25834.1 hypothetical protein NEOLI_000556 [Neolecta irregularis DAH-3]